MTLTGDREAFLPGTLGAVEPLVYAAAVAIALGVALLAGLPAARRGGLDARHRMRHPMGR